MFPPSPTFTVNVAAAEVEVLVEVLVDVLVADSWAKTLKEIRLSARIRSAAFMLAIIYAR